MNTNKQGFPSGSCARRLGGRRTSAHLAQVDEEGAGGSVHAVVAVAGVRAPHLLHPLRKKEHFDNKLVCEAPATLTFTPVEPHEPSASLVSTDGALQVQVLKLVVGEN